MSSAELQPAYDSPRISLTCDILLHITSFLDLRTIQAWRATSLRMDAAGAEFMRSRYYRALRQHFTDPTGFRSVLRATGSVVSGSVALAVLDIERADRWTANDLDLLVPVNFVKRVHSYITKVEGYVHVSTHHASQYEECGGFLSVSRYENKNGMLIDLVKSFHHSALYPIPYFWSTLLMNYLSADSYCVGYPTLTLDGRGLLNPIALIDNQFVDYRVLAVMDKYGRRGYDFRDYAYAFDEDAEATCGQDQDENCPRTIRYFGDPFCLTGTVGTISEAVRTSESRAQPDKAFLVRWWRGGNACGGTCEHPIPRSSRADPYAATHRVPYGFFDTFVGGGCVNGIPARPEF